MCNASGEWGNTRIKGEVPGGGVRSISREVAGRHVPGVGAVGESVGGGEMNGVTLKTSGVIGRSRVPRIEDVGVGRYVIKIECINNGVAVGVGTLTPDKFGRGVVGNARVLGRDKNGGGGGGGVGNGAESWNRG